MSRWPPPTHRHDPAQALRYSPPGSRCGDRHRSSLPLARDCHPAGRWNATSHKTGTYHAPHSFYRCTGGNSTSHPPKLARRPRRSRRSRRHPDQGRLCCRHVDESTSIACPKARDVVRRGVDGRPHSDGGRGSRRRTLARCRRPQSVARGAPRRAHLIPARADAARPHVVIGLDDGDRVVRRRLPFGGNARIARAAHRASCVGYWVDDGACRTLPLVHEGFDPLEGLHVHGRSSRGCFDRRGGRSGIAVAFVHEVAQVRAYSVLARRAHVQLKRADLTFRLLAGEGGGQHPDHQSCEVHCERKRPGEVQGEGGLHSHDRCAQRSFLRVVHDAELAHSGGCWEESTHRSEQDLGRFGTSEIVDKQGYAQLRLQEFAHQLHRPGARLRPVQGGNAIDCAARKNQPQRGTRRHFDAKPQLETTGEGHAGRGPEGRRCISAPIRGQNESLILEARRAREREVAKRSGIAPLVVHRNSSKRGRSRGHVYRETEDARVQPVGPEIQLHASWQRAREGVERQQMVLVAPQAAELRHGGRATDGVGPEGEIPDLTGEWMDQLRIAEGQEQGVHMAQAAARAVFCADRHCRALQRRVRCFVQCALHSLLGHEVANLHGQGGLLHLDE
eukprot:scaffold1642_cov252-Pinguiococcus_pyrenoidosus.AAC.42